MKTIYNLKTMLKPENEAYVVITTVDDYSLIRRNTEFQPWVVAWLLNETERYWEQGYYFENFMDAVKFMASKTEVDNGNNS